jgi:uncharacterized protein YjiS (DUF1127 family)
MTFSSFEHSASGRRPSLPISLFQTVLALRARMVGAWQQHRRERALEGLSYDMLKDIGFPSATAAKTGNPTR